MATTNDKIKAAFVFYGTGVDDITAVKQVIAPAYGFYGGNDARVHATIPKSDSLIKAAGKKHEPWCMMGQDMDSCVPARNIRHQLRMRGHAMRHLRD
jgi:dienelactone hydrolase